MIRNGEITVAEAKRIIRNYWWILPLTTVGLGVLGLLAAVVLPKRYTSQTLVLVDQPTVSADIVKPVVTEDLNQRLASMQGQILGRTRLQPIIEKFGLYAEDRKRVPMEELVDRLRNSVTVKPLEPMAGTQNRNLPGFYVSEYFQRAKDRLLQFDRIGIRIGVSQEADWRAFGHRSQANIAQAPAQKIKERADD